jgi:membrane-bound ClpP family serine protease
MEYVITASIVLFASILLLVEIILIPGLGLTGILGIMSMIGAVIYSFSFIGCIAGWITLGFGCAICVIFILWALYGKSLDKVALKKNIDSTVKEDEISKFAVGDKGIARTRLALIGEAEINGLIVEVKSESGFVDEGEPVEVVRLSGDTVFVKVIK